ncbi:hypothetical protein GCM10022221_63110 [Actinocorallia aurea]
MAVGDPQRVAAIMLDVRPRWGLTPAQREELYAALEHCPVLASLRTPPRVSATITCPTGGARPVAAV